MFNDFNTINEYLNFVENKFFICFDDKGYINEKTCTYNF